MEQPQSANQMRANHSNTIDRTRVQDGHLGGKPPSDAIILLPDRSRHRQRVRRTQWTAAASVSFAVARAMIRP